MDGIVPIDGAIHKFSDHLIVIKPSYREVVAYNLNYGVHLRGLCASRELTIHIMLHLV